MPLARGFIFYFYFYFFFPRSKAPWKFLSTKAVPLREFFIMKMMPIFKEDKICLNRIIHPALLNKA
jgi:hypothetical protein